MEANCQVHAPAAFTLLERDCRCPQVVWVSGPHKHFWEQANFCSSVWQQYLCYWWESNLYCPVVRLVARSLHWLSYPCSPLYCRWVTHVFPALPFAKHHPVWLQHLPGSMDSGLQRETGASVVNFRVLKDQMTCGINICRPMYGLGYTYISFYMLSARNLWNQRIMGMYSASQVHMLNAERIYRVLHQNFHFTLILFNFAYSWNIWSGIDQWV